MRFHEVPWDSMMFHEIPWSSMRFYNIPVNQSVPTEANRGLTSYRILSIDPEVILKRFTQQLQMKLSVRG
jgi:hypothetical protein